MTELTPFVVLAAERTGSNLLAGLLDSHPAIVAAGELFNPVVIRQRTVPFPLISKREREELVALRESDPIAFLDRFAALARGKGRGIVGFKLMYFHADRHDRVRDHLVAERKVRVIHLRRRNLLRRFVSNERAKLTGKWQRAAGEKTRTELPKLEVSLDTMLRDFVRVEQWQHHYAELFAEHPMLDIEYEELAARPVEVGRRVVEFLGADPDIALDVRYAKTGTDSMRDAVANYDDLRDMLSRWSSFFED